MKHSRLGRFKPMVEWNWPTHIGREAVENRNVVFIAAQRLEHRAIAQSGSLSRITPEKRAARSKLCEAVENDSSGSP